jgi:hypothetical protein
MRSRKTRGEEEKIMFPVLAESEIQVSGVNHRRLLADLQRTQLIRAATSATATSISETLPNRHWAPGWARAIHDLLVRPGRRAAAERVEGAHQPSA